MLEMQLKEQVKMLTQDIFNAARGTLKDGTYPDSGIVTLCAALLLEVGQYDNPEVITLEYAKQSLSSEGKMIADQRISETLFEELKNICFYSKNGYKYTKEVIEDVMLHPVIEDEDASTPDFIIKLAAKMLNIDNGFPTYTGLERIADFGAGKGNFAIEYALNYPSVPVSPGSFSRMINSFETNFEASAICSVKCKYLTKKHNSSYLFRTENCDIFKKYCLDVKGAQNYSFDKIFVHHDWPNGKKRPIIALGNYAYEYVEKYVAEEDNFKNYMYISSEWVMNHLVMDYLDEAGKAVVIMSSGSLVNKADKIIRDKFIRNGWIEKVISLPNKLFPNANDQVYMLVFSRHNEKIQFVDASNCYTPGRRYNELSDADIDNIIDCCNEENMNCSVITNDMVLDNNSSLLAERYTYINNCSNYCSDNVIKEDSTEVFENYICNIKRGAPLTAQKLDELDSLEPTEYNYLRLKDLVNNDIPEELPYLKNMESNLEKYLLKDGDLVISKTAKPFKVAVANIDEDKKILPVGSMYAIELDQEKVNPYYLQALFVSKKGYDLIVNASAGTVITMIPLELLKAIKLNLPSKAEQDEKAIAYLKAKEKIAALRRQLAEAEMEITHILD